MTYALLGIDIGTNATKGVLYDLDGHELAVASHSYPLLTPKPGWVEQDPEAVEEALVLVMSDIVAAAGKRKIVGLALAAQAGSIIPCDDQGDPVYPMVTWLDQRSEDIVEHWRSTGLIEIIRDESGWRPFPGLPLPTICWLRRWRPDIHQAAKRFLGAADYCIHRLTDQFATDLSAAAEMVLLDLETQWWSDELCELAGISPDNQSQLGWAGRKIGVITEAIAARTGLQAGTPVIAAGHDQCCACLGIGMIDPGGVMLSTGTAWVITAITDTPHVSAIPQPMDLNFHVVPQRWTASQYLGGFGATVEWWLEQSWHSPLPDQRLDRPQLFQAFNGALTDSIPGSNDLLFLPLGGPAQLGTRIRGAFVGLSLSHTRTDMSRAILESTGFELRWAVENLRSAGMPVNELWIAGGATNSPIWPQILADVSGLRIFLADYSSWAALGAAALAGWGAGVFEDLSAAVMRLRPSSHHLDPDPSLGEFYGSRFAAYQEAAMAILTAEMGARKH